MITFTIPGEPVTWKRAARNGRRTYTPPDMLTAKADVATIARTVVSGTLHPKCAIGMRVRCYMKPPKQINYDERPYPLKADVDNLAKLVMDAVQGVVFEDDKQVVDLHVTREWAQDDNPRTEVDMWVMEGARNE